MSGKAVRNIQPLYAPFKNKKYSIIIPCAGQSVKIKSFGSKSLVKLSHNVNLIQHQLRVINDVFNNNEIILVSGFEADRVFKSVCNIDIKFVENENYNTTNISRSIGMALKVATTDRILIIYGDLFFSKGAINLPFRNKSMLVTSNTMKAEKAGCSIVNNELVNMHYDFNPKWSQISFFVNKETELLKRITWNRKNDKMFGFEIINEIINHGGSFSIADIPSRSYVYELDNSKDIENIRVKFNHG